MQTHPGGKGSCDTRSCALSLWKKTKILPLSSEGDYPHQLVNIRESKEVKHGVNKCPADSQRLPVRPQIQDTGWGYDCGKIKQLAPMLTPAMLTPGFLGSKYELFEERVLRVVC